MAPAIAAVFAISSSLSAVLAAPLQHTISNFGPNAPSTHLHSLLSHSPLSIASDVSFAAAVTPEETALQYLAKAAHVPRSSLRIRSSVDSKGRMRHIHIQQHLGGLDITNAVGNVNLDASGNVISAGHNFVPIETFSAAVTAFNMQGATTLSSKHPLQEQIPLLVMESGSSDFNIKEEVVSNAIPYDINNVKLNPVDAVIAAGEYLGIDAKSARLTQSLMADSENDSHMSFLVTGVPNAIKDIPAKLMFIQGDGGHTLTPVWDVTMDLDSNWFHIQVDAHTGQVMGLIDWVNGASYNVYTLGNNDPDAGSRTMVADTAHPDASPYGWHSQGTVRDAYNVTIGNNVFAQDNPDGGNSWRKNYRPSAGKDMLFDFPINQKKQPSTYLDAAITNLFYYNNIMHDLFYLYGFDEVAGNFQLDNFGKGGRGNDAVIANAQDGSGYNNANFATPPDGSQPRMRMYVWSLTKPYHDGDLEGGIIIHEYAHGISIRLTGGPSNSDCLGWGESGGMGEGWGDFFATIVRMTPNTTRDEDFSMGSYASGRVGIRKFVYSTSLKTNPSTYGFLRKPAYWEVHAKGEVWAEILFEFYWALVEKHGFDGDWFNNQGSNEPGLHLKGLSGNKLALQLVVDGLKLQPCYPTFVSARDAILLADQVGTKGENQCVIWTAFAKRGLGLSALSGGTEAFDVPDECKDTSEPDPSPPKKPKGPKKPKHPKKKGSESPI
ncbi:hypothetical protein BASA61_007001 [Batrachochytrium salamandrivorans]|nr:hypothetical protein BASA61_007001 [Batrachochytrium salamandrivorans]KAH9254942.1 hypothetical protein BASA81_007009 [Batrachochytrium salamandrivorans]KAH9265577.1 hypothetical protein BASA84_001581 [Batrachochytrium salamandrivorans]